jgi:predicted enzyme related to lactoylglutathione lyase
MRCGRKMEKTVTMNETGSCKSVCPIMPTTDVTRTVKFYEALGFVVQVHGDFVMTSRDAVELFLSLKPDHDPKRTASCVYIRVDDADSLHARWNETGIVGLRELRNTDYKMREFAVIDPDGNLMLYGSRCSTEEAPGSL